MTTCPTCGKDTANPKFCSRSCAAKLNNAATPKRTPQGKCERCGTPISVSRKNCTKCVAAERKLKERRQSRNRSFVTLDGKDVEGEIENVWMSGRMRFAHRGFQRDVIKPSSRVDALIRRLTAICFKRPEYMTHQAAARHIVLMNELKSFPTHSYAGRERFDVQTADLRVEELAYTLRQWVFSYFEKNHHRLLPCYALDTACFVMAHVDGYDSYGDEESWSIDSIVQRAKEPRREFVDSGFKREFTMSLGRPLVTGVVPPGGQIVDHNGATIVSGGTSFLFSIERCHLSTGVYDHPWFEAQWPAKPKYDLSDDFDFYGSAWIFRDGEQYMLADIERVLSLPNREIQEHNHKMLFNGYHMHLPAEWLSASIEFDLRDFDGRPHLSPVPSWTAEFP